MLKLIGRGVKKNIKRKARGKRGRWKIMEKLKIEELKKDLWIGDLGDRFRDYDCGYICDIITEIADNNVDIYYYDLFEWAKDNFSIIEEANEEMGAPNDIIKQIQQGEFLAFERELYENLEDNLKYFMYDYIEKDLQIKEITEEQNENLLDWDFSDNNEQLENLIEHINEILTENNEN